MRFHEPGVPVLLRVERVPFWIVQEVLRETLLRVAAAEIGVCIIRHRKKPNAQTTPLEGSPSTMAQGHAPAPWCASCPVSAGMRPGF